MNRVTHPSWEPPLFEQGMVPDSSLGAQVTTIDTTELAWAFCSAFTSEMEPVLEQVLGPTAAPTNGPTQVSPTPQTSGCSGHAWELSYGIAAILFACSSI